MSKLTHDKTMEMIVFYQRTGCNDTAEVLIKSNMNLLRKVVHKFAPVYGVDDMMQQAMMGFYEGLSRFEVERGFALSTFMYRHVYAYVQRWVRNFQTVRTNRTTQELQPKAKAFIEKYYNEYGKHISSFELAKYMDIQHWQATEVLQTITHYGVSLDANNAHSDGESTFHDVLPNYDAEIRVESIQLRLALSILEERERSVIKLYHFDGYGQREIGEQMNLTQTAVSRILKKAHENLRHLMQEC